MNILKHHKNVLIGEKETTNEAKNCLAVSRYRLFWMFYRELKISQLKKFSGEIVF
jgi:hypothetical protein